MMARTDHLNPALAAASTARAQEHCPLATGTARGDGTVEGAIQAAFELGAEYGHRFPLLADARLREVWDELDECLRHERDGTDVQVPVADLRVLRDALRAAYAEHGDEDR